MNASSPRPLPVLLAVAAVSAVAVGAWWLRPAPPRPAGRQQRAPRHAGHHLSRRHAPGRSPAPVRLRCRRSPHLDALAADSVVFDRAYGAAPWTLPSVASLLTSTFACEHGVVRIPPKPKSSSENPGGTARPARLCHRGLLQQHSRGAVANLNRGYGIAEERKSDRERPRRRHRGVPRRPRPSLSTSTSTRWNPTNPSRRRSGS